MGTVRNPFRPTFGSPPPRLVGRDDLIALFVDALEFGPGAPGRATLYTGARGTGKTVMLNAVEEAARARGWIVLSETATPKLLDRLAGEHLPELLAQYGPPSPGPRLTGLTGPAGLGGVTWAHADGADAVPGLRRQLVSLLDALAPRGTGLLLTIDEVHRRVIADLRQIGAEVQHAFRGEREIAFVAAGLPEAVSELTDDDTVTFLRRADRHVLAALSEPDVEEALRSPISDAGRLISDEALSIAAQATAGYPFLVQLVGYHMWAQRTDAVSIGVPDAAAGIVAARRRVGSLVHEPMIRPTSDLDRVFLLAMAEDDGPTRIADVAERAGIADNLAQQYRMRLIAAELIRPAGHGRVEFSLPFLRDYLLEHAAQLRRPHGTSGGRTARRS